MHATLRDAGRCGTNAQLDPHPPRRSQPRDDDSRVHEGASIASVKKKLGEEKGEEMRVGGELPISSGTGSAFHTSIPTLCPNVRRYDG
jgi:hypothetical protein